MSIFMTLLIALKALNRNKMRTMLTMLGMIIGVGAVITMVALGKGAQIDDRRTGQGRGHEPDHRHGRQLHAGRRAAGRRHVDDADPGRRPGAASGSRCAVPRGRRQLARPAHCRQSELVEPDPGHRRRPPADQELADQVRHLLHGAGRRHGAEGGGSRPDRLQTICSVQTTDPTGQIIRDQEPAVQSTGRHGA